MKTSLTALILTLSLILLTACHTSVPSEVSVIEQASFEITHEELVDPIAVNISTKRVHFYLLCPHVENTKEENLRYLSMSSDAVNTLLSMGYTLCSDCCDR